MANATREATALCEAAGYENICIETVGVGQSEVAVRNMCDFMLLLLLPGSGDDLQGIKRGIVELADMIAINKADGVRVDLANATRQNYMHAAHLLAPREHNQRLRVVACSAEENVGIDTIWKLMSEFRLNVRESGFVDELRHEQDVTWFEERVEKLLHKALTEIEPRPNGISARDGHGQIEQKIG